MNTLPIHSVDALATSRINVIGQPTPVPPLPPVHIMNGNTGIVPPYITNPTKDAEPRNPGIVPPWLQYPVTPKPDVRIGFETLASR